ncbi:hypothetical protein COEREDRAFT_90171 [Coemansia reversa NRRL 1564]|uniref:DNA-directed DNA polymerase n=1 Tax=Coemansia reversa (strain ATCC 12441 / NRRL 1564) TaxID=763665 RepID=A0A2G5B0L2_COERN|nr:hypothetical protein COEREDRAFT_90171 [Coemansia reversa NRRL 1564]|eukprot:PIA12566.1 hypothetical protein COEREDRAFT_90171 [Coemansia reversa NRRL 1564]
MDPRDIHEFGFDEGDYDSDLESVISDGGDESFVLEDWQAGVNTFDAFEFRYYTLKRDELVARYEEVGVFVDTIFSGLRRFDNVTAVRLLADIHDLDNDEDIRWSQNIRFELSNFVNRTELRTALIEYLKTDTAPVWHRLLTDETSDKGYNKLVKYHRNYFDFCIQKPRKSRKQVTTICGEREIHPGVFVKLVTDHGIPYWTNDCLIQSLNEVFDRREDPTVIRKEIWGSENYLKDLHRSRHINYIARRYNTKLILSDLGEQKTLVFNGACLENVVQLVKVGTVLGILDRIDHTVDKRNTNKTIAYFDLETVGPDQRVYAFTWRHKDGDLTICHNNFDEVEEQLVNKVMSVINNADDNSTTITYSWNGSRFDNWIVFKLLKKKFNKKLWIHDIIVNSANELLTFKLTLNDGGETQRHMVFKDPKKMFSVSIPEACKVFFPNGISPAPGFVIGSQSEPLGNNKMKKHEFDHDKVDKAYMEGGLDDFIKENWVIIVDYVRQDGVLLEELTKQIAKLYAQEDINMYTVLTRSVASSIAWQKTIEHHKILKDVTLSPYAEICGGIKYNDIMDHAIGGRTQCVQRGTFNNVCGIDVNSMYPYVCANRMYPCGEIVELKDGETPPKDKLGVYLVRIKKQSYPHVIPYRRSKHYAYNWQFTDKPFEKWITSVDMEQLDDTPLEERTENFVSQNYDIIKGFYWTDKTDKFYKDFMIDNYGERTSIEKSDPRNMHIKLKMNGVTGSVFQHSFRELIMIFTKEEFEENVKKYSELVTVIGCESINERQYIVTMRPVRFNEGDPRIKAQREFCKGAITQKPWVLTMFTYSHARKVLRDEWIKLEERGCKVIYCDTDSLFFQNNGSVDRKEYISNDKQLGKWSIECWNDEGSFYTPKVYAIKNIGKLRIKGVGFNSLVTDTEHKNADLNYDQKLKLYLDTAITPRCAKHNDIDCASTNVEPSRISPREKCASCPKRGGVHPSYRHVKDLVDGKPLKTINFIMEKSSQHGIQKKYEIKIIR